MTAEALNASLTTPVLMYTYGAIDFVKRNLFIVSIYIEFGQVIIDNILCVEHIVYWVFFW